MFGAACSESGSDTDADASASPTSAASTTVSASGGTGTASASSTADVDLPMACPQVIPTVEVDKALGIQLPGVPVFAMGEPEPDIQRLGRATCLFGVQPDGVTAAVQASVFAYATPQVASSRVEATVSDARDQGQLTEDVTAGDTPAVILNGASDLTVVAAKDARTYSATLSFGVIAGTEQKPAVIKLLTAMLAAAAQN